MKVATVFALLLVSASAFNAPQFATRAVGKAPATKAVKKKAVKVKKVKAPRDRTPPESKGYPSIAEKAQSFRLGKGKISGGGSADRVIEPVFIHPTVNNEPAPQFDYKEAAKARKTPQTQDYVFDDGLTVLERKQKAIIPAFLTGSARSRVEVSEIRDDIAEDLYPFGLSADRFQLLFISAFSLFTLVGCLSGSVQLD